MSIEALNWARSANVAKSTSKLVLLNLAMLVRFDAKEWTIFASIDYLARVTHLNRKTVIEALARLRAMGAIANTGRRAGDNRCCVVYKICPNAVQMVEDTAAVAAQADDESQGDDPKLALQRREAVQQTESIVPVGSEHPVGKVEAIPQSQGLTAPVDQMPLVDRSDAGRASSPQISSTCPDRRGPRAPAAGSAATRLPSGWLLPENWLKWTQRERGHWTKDKIDAMATTFCAYMRSRPGEAGMSHDWFESWRLWVFRERDGKAPRKDWQESWSGILAKGRTLGIVQNEGEPPPHFKHRVFQAVGMSLMC